MRRTLLWAGWWAGFAVLDVWADHYHQGLTFSEWTRDAFRTHTRLGRATFTAAYASGAWVLHRHICKE